jgi:hypothetical protein
MNSLGGQTLTCFSRYIEASSVLAGQQAHLVSPIINSTYNGYACTFSFWFHMYGKDVRSLSVSVRGVQSDNVFQTLWIRQAPPNAADEVHDQWQRASFDLDRFANRGAIQLRISADANGPYGDIAIDDVEIVCGDNDAPGSQCICNAGYSGDGFSCTVNDGEIVTDPTTEAPVTDQPPIDSCPPDAPSAEQEICKNRADNAVCVNGQGYRNEFCAYCNGATDSQIQYGPCFTDPSKFVSSCPDGSDEQLAQECLFFSQHFKCDAKTETVTYKNVYCAQCNGLAPSDVTDGACNTGSFIHPCSTIKCGRNAQCALTVADCDFEDPDTPLCGWTNIISSDKYDYDQFNWLLDSNGTLTEGTGPDVDHTTLSEKGHYLYIEASSAQEGWEAHLGSPIFDVRQPPKKKPRKTREKKKLSFLLIIISFSFWCA